MRLLACGFDSHRRYHRESPNPAFRSKNLKFNNVSLTGEDFLLLYQDYTLANKDHPLILRNSCIPTITEADDSEMEVETLNDHHRDYEFQLTTPSSIAKDLSYSFEQVRNNLYSALQRILIYEPLKIIQNGPAFIVIWSDGTKTVLKKKDGDQDDIYAAFGQALMIKVFGSNSHAHDIVDKKFIKEEKKEKKNHE